MIEPRELITVCRQIGGMMEAGVDILRVTRVLRAQTDNPRLLEALEEIERALRLGASVSEALERVPDVFSPYAVSLVAEGEARRDIPGAFLHIADFLQQEGETAPIFEPKPPAQNINVAYLGDRSPVTVGVVRELLEGVQTVTLRVLTIAAGLLLSLAAVWFSVEMGWVERRWSNVTLASVAALFMGGAGIWLRRRRDLDHERSKGCGLCGVSATADVRLQRLPTLNGVMVCDSCAATIAATAEFPGVPGISREMPGEKQTYTVSPQPSSPEPTLATRQQTFAEERHQARKRYGPLADVPDAMNVEPDIYDVDDARLNLHPTARAATNGQNDARKEADSSGAQRSTSSSHRNEADFD
jgi:hypothetical protein